MYPQEFISQVRSVLIILLELSSNPYRLYTLYAAVSVMCYNCEALHPPFRSKNVVPSSTWIFALALSIVSEDLTCWNEVSLG